MMKLSNQIQSTTQFLIDTLGVSLKAIYLYGSYVEGGLKYKSDIDLFIIVDQAISLETKKALIESLLLLSGEIDNNKGKRYLEVTIINQTELSNLEFPLHREFQYGEWLREDFLNGYIPKRTIDQDLTILLRQIRQNNMVLYGIPAHELLPLVSEEEFNRSILTLLPVLMVNLKDDTTNVILTLCRMFYSLQTGQITSKDKAVNYLLKYAIPESFKPLLIQVKDNYLGNKNTDQPINQDVVVEFANFISSLILQYQENY
ncbi:DUF4111 domain-containing protein [Myroides odoratimimus]|uniref:aminoglycoside adenylyltransferase family protein n=1 Tax=Myroides odoratimimus TaxID=76832 RepID=UPI002574E730|nr:aminoglycoside adenylyltransferase family protein [Myroides odoratimimus]MDM1402176.1 DUF4111 domain-containing protein [Myroides odoratimimus]MEC4036592.1 aminoglycoside adenylyltransferase family protein [Myroides odoratimimus]